MAEFHETRTGRKFFESDVPNIAEQLKRIANALNVPTTAPHQQADEGVWVAYQEDDPTELVVLGTRERAREHLLRMIDADYTAAVALSHRTAEILAERERIDAWDGKRPATASGWRVVYRPVMR